MRLVVVVTGCSKGGIGWALCEEFYKRGHQVFAASRNLSKSEGLAREAEEGKGSISLIELDVNSRSSVDSGVAEIVRRAGRIDLLLNNAGQGCVGPLVEVTEEAYRQTFEVNVFGLISMVQAVSPHMIRARSGTIVNIGSIVAYVPTPWASIYCATKAAVHSLSDCLRMELRGFGISVVCVAPGAIKSAIGASNDKRAVLGADSFYSDLESSVRARGSWSQTPRSTPASALAKSIAGGVLVAHPPPYLSLGYRSTSAALSYYL
ncbi:hypothetical protein BCR35DRAFT_287305, partial [Leucosporidium creatinivorum]